MGTGMMKTTYIMLALALLAGCNTKTPEVDSRLVGTWVFNPARTLERAKQLGFVKQDQSPEWKFRDLDLRKIVVTDSLMNFEFGNGDLMTNSYRILGSDAMCITVELSESDGPQYIRLIEFENQGMWYPRGRGHEAKLWLCFTKEE